MLALDRASRGLAETASEAPADTEPDTEPDTTTMLARGLARRGARARAALRDVKRALAEVDAPRAGESLAAAREIAAPLGDRVLRAWIEIFESELAFVAGDARDTIERSCAAEDLARASGDEATYLAVWWLRAVRALRRGDGGAGELMTRWMDGWLGRVSPRARMRLHVAAAAFALDDERADHAIDVAAAVVGSAPGTVEAALAGSVIAQALLGADRPTDAARIATSSIDRCPGLPPALAARLYLDAATALEATGATEHAVRCHTAALRLDPDVARPTTSADLTAVGFEARLL